MRRQGRNGDIGLLVLVILDHLSDVHPVDVIRTEHNHEIWGGLLDEVEILMDGIGGSSVPLLALGSHLGRHRNQELVFQNTPQLPTIAQVLQKGLAAKLDQHVNGENTGIDQIAEHEVDNSVLSTKGDCRLGTFMGQWIEPRSLASGENKGKNLELHNSS
jgi:hypothetical protein